MQKIRTWIILLFITLCAHSAYAQTTIRISGIVKDSLTEKPLANVSVYPISGTGGVITGADGHYTLEVRSSVTALHYRMTGYHLVTKEIKKDNGKTDLWMDAYLTPAYESLEDVVVSTKQEGKYSNKHNPAVELIRLVIAHKAENVIGAYPTATYEKYEKLCMYLDKFPRWISNAKMVEKFKFIFDNRDTSKVPGKELTPVFIEETVSQNYYRRQPEKTRSVITGQNKVDYGDFIDSRGLSAIFNRLYEDINVYDNQIVVFTKQFISPIADMGPTFYKYYIRDTITENDSSKFIRLYFMPRNPADLLFTGTLYITLDGHYAVQQLSMYTNRHMNLGVIRSFSVKQQFTKDTTDRYYLSNSDVIGDFGFTSGGSGMYGERSVTFTNFKTGQPIADSLFKGRSTDTRVDSIVLQAPSFWADHRPDTLTNAQASIYQIVDSLHGMKSYKRLMDYTNMFATGYKSFGPVEVGSIYTFLSYNPVEGYKPRFGGRTTTELSKTLYGDGYLAYGSIDKQWKYYGRFTYALNHKSIYTYPLHYISASYRHDTNIPGVSDEYIEDNILLSIKRGNNTRYLYNSIFRVDYLREFNNHFSYSLGFKYKKQAPAGSLYFISNQAIPDTISSLNTSEFSIAARWAPHEQFYQTEVSRTRINTRYPIMLFNYTRGIKGMFGSDYNYNRFSLSIYKRFYLSPFGYANVTLSAGAVTGRLPWPLLIVHSGNQGFAYSGSSFNTMNYLEFVSDHYVALAVDHSFKGFFLNKIPLIKKLKWREVIAGKILFGGAKSDNSPENSSSIYKFPTINNIETTYVLNGTPYIEGSVGIANIFKILRIDFVKRFTYLDHPYINTGWGFRFLIKPEL